MCEESIENQPLCDEHNPARAFIHDEPADVPEAVNDVQRRADKILASIGYCGHYMHFHGGGRSGKAPILCLLAKNGGNMAQSELGMYLELKPGSLSEILTKLENAGLIERTRNESDRRQMLVSLTDEGTRKAVQEQTRRERFRANAFANLTQEEQETLVSLLQKVRTQWEGFDD